MTNTIQFKRFLGRFSCPKVATCGFFFVLSETCCLTGWMNEWIVLILWSPYTHFIYFKLSFFLVMRKTVECRCCFVRPFSTNKVFRPCSFWTNHEQPLDWTSQSQPEPRSEGAFLKKKCGGGVCGASILLPGREKRRVRLGGCWMGEYHWWENGPRKGVL